MYRYVRHRVSSVSWWHFPWLAILNLHSKASSTRKNITVLLHYFKWSSPEFETDSSSTFCYSFRYFLETRPRRSDQLPVPLHVGQKCWWNISPKQKPYTVEQHFLLERFRDANSVKSVEEEDTWYGTVDGNFCGESKFLFINSSPVCENFMWAVNVVGSRFLAEKYW